MEIKWKIFGFFYFSFERRLEAFCPLEMRVFSIDDMADRF